MSHRLIRDRVLLVGAGGMAVAHAHALAALGITPRVFGRGEASAARFRGQTGIEAGTGLLADQISAERDLPATAVVAVNAHALAEVTETLMRAGVRRLLVEKPAALDLDELDRLRAASRETGATVHVAYNRRFMASVLRADDFIAEDGGILSVRFDFTEPAARIAGLGKPARELATWFYGNSTHVLDLALHFFGPPELLSATVAGQGAIDWHPSGAVYAGYGRGPGNRVLSWHANWLAPGRWGVEVMTSRRKLILQPLERLRVQEQGSFAEVEVELEDGDDRAFKPGVLKQLRAFLTGDRAERLQDLEAHARCVAFYECIRTGGTLPEGGQAR